MPFAEAKAKLIGELLVGRYALLSAGAMRANMEREQGPASGASKPLLPSVESYRLLGLIKGDCVDTCGRSRQRRGARPACPSELGCTTPGPPIGCR